MLNESISRAELRRMVFDIFRTDTDLSSFLLDYFPDVKHKLSDGMTRDAKVNLLFEVEDVTKIYATLASAYPEKIPVDPRPQVTTTSSAIRFAVPTASAAEGSERTKIHAALCAMLPAEFDKLIFLLDMNTALMSGVGTPRSTLAIELVKFHECEGSAGLVRLIAAINKTAPRLLRPGKAQ